MKNYFSIFGLDEMVSIIILAGAGVLLLLVIFLVLNHLVLSNQRSKRKVAEIVDRYEYIHSSFLGRDTTNLSRVEFISRTNLIYVSKHQEFSAVYRDIVDNDDAEMVKTINSLKLSLDDRRYKDLKIKLPAAKEQLEEYEKKVNDFSDRLIELLQPEEGAKEKSGLIKQDVREIKRVYEENAKELELVQESFDTVFANIDKQFNRFETLVGYANYEDALALLPPLEQIVSFLKDAVRTLPDLCVQLQSILPEKLSSLIERYRHMIEENYSLFRILSDEDVDALKAELKSMVEAVKAFKITGIQERINVMTTRIEDYNLAFDKEVEAKTLYEQKSHKAYELESQAEQNLIDLNNLLPSVKKVYALSEEAQANLDAIGAQVNQAGATRRKLDSLTSSLSKQPYSSFVDKMNSLEEESEKALTMLADFNNHLKQLKSECLSWKQNITLIYERSKDCERKLREMNLPDKNEVYLPSFLKLYRKIDESYHCLMNAPINIGAIKKNMEEIVNSDALFLDVISNNYEQMKLADASILLANHYRGDYVQFDALLRQAETLYYQGDFEEAYRMVSSELARRKSEQ